MGSGQVKTPQSLLFLQRFNHFPQIHIPQIVAILWLISSLKKLTLTISASVLIAFMEDQIFGDPYSTILEMFLQDFFK